MAQQPSSPQDLPADFAERVLLFPTREPTHVPAEIQAQSTRRPATARKVRARRRVIRQVVVLEVAGRLSDVVEDLDRAIQLALAELPRGVVCDLSAVLEDAEPVAVEVLAMAGRHVRDWPGIPVAVACPDPQLREALAAHPLGGHLIVTASLFSAVSAVLATPVLAVESLQLTPHPTAPRASRDFVTRTLLDWRLGRVIPFATLVVSELVANSSVNAGTDIDLSIVWDRGALRLTLRDHGPGRPGQLSSALDLSGRRLAVVAGLSRTFGVLPTADGGKVVWAVLEASRPRSATRRIRSGRSTESQDLPVFTDGRGMAELPFCAGSSEPPALASIRPLRVRDHTFA
ncbi:MAG TPA: ATP-binding protein [Dermatophilaceae bacterium]|nr:ATP-binding protein [Dermatophilaceae bacterium]